MNHQKHVLPVFRPPKRNAGKSRFKLEHSPPIQNNILVNAVVRALLLDLRPRKANS